MYDLLEKAVAYCDPINHHDEVKENRGCNDQFEKANISSEKQTILFQKKNKKKTLDIEENTGAPIMKNEPQGHRPKMQYGCRHTSEMPLFSPFLQHPGW